MKQISHNKIIIVSAILVLIMSLAACGGKTDETDKSDASTTGVTSNTDQDKDADQVKEESDKSKEGADADAEPMPADKPAEKSAAKPAEKPATKPAEKPAKKPADTPAAEPSKKPASHTHHWKEHHASKQVWVSKIVPVYETQQVQVGTNKVYEGSFWHCNCGAVVPEKDTDAHMIAHIEAGEPSNGYGREHFREEPIYEEKQVQVGTKDEGHYETQSYVDYHYCDCGAKK